MKYYGLDRSKVRMGIMEHMVSKQSDEYLAVPSKGYFVLKNDSIVYDVELAGKRAELSMAHGRFNATLEELNGDFCLQCIIRKGELFELLISIGDTLEESKVGLDEQIVEHYAKCYHLQSKEQLKNFISVLQV